MSFKDLFLRINVFWGRAGEKGYKIRIIHYPLSRLTRVQELWARYPTRCHWKRSVNVSTSIPLLLFLEGISSVSYVSWVLIRQWPDGEIPPVEFHCPWLIIDHIQQRSTKVLSGSAAVVCLFAAAWREASVCSSKVDRHISCFSCFCITHKCVNLNSLK